MENNERAFHMHKKRPHPNRRKRHIRSNSSNLRMRKSKSKFLMNGGETPVGEIVVALEPGSEEEDDEEKQNVEKYDTCYLPSDLITETMKLVVSTDDQSKKNLYEELKKTVAGDSGRGDERFFCAR